MGTPQTAQERAVRIISRAQVRDQRTANYCVPLRNGPIDPAWQRQIKASYPDIFKQCRDTPGAFLHAFDPRSALAVSPDERLAQYEQLWAEPGFKKWLANFYDIMLPGEANEDYAAFVRQKIRERVTDPVVAEKLVEGGVGLRRAEPRGGP